ncbi:MAG: carbonate dehydratase [Kiritimatiellae bacterium]|jgi:carbonic anhydrase|nr:carbonate dehydratase [Kiritimatiellia bacterium]
MYTYKKLLENNQQWAKQIEDLHPGFFAELSEQQNPRFMWIGCSDSRVPANQITGLDPGEVFVHRNVANIVSHGDLNCLSALQYSVDVLKVRHVIVCGHYNCGGVCAVMEGLRLGMVDNWLGHLHEVKVQHLEELQALPVSEQSNRLCELNVLRQVRNVCESTILQDAWSRGQEVSVHGWVYSLKDGILRETSAVQTGPDFRKADEGRT